MSQIQFASSSELLFYLDFTPIISQMQACPSSNYPLKYHIPHLCPNYPQNWCHKHFRLWNNQYYC